VTAKLLTGFDAPIEGVMYLDKPLRLHTLFQAICRTNRRWTNPVTGQEKHFGLIVDYVGLGAEIAKSLRAANPEKGGRRPVDPDGLLAEFEVAIELALAKFAGIDRSDFSFAALAAAQDRLPPGETRDTFAREFLTVHHLWEFLDPHPALATRRADYRWLAQVYESVQPTGEKRSASGTLVARPVKKWEHFLPRNALTSTFTVGDTGIEPVTSAV
jgi:type I restriction enzyme R subunit